MRRRLLTSNLIVIGIVLLLLEIPLALVYSRHEHDAFDAGLQRDADALGALSEEIVEHPGDHDVGALVRRFSAGGGSAGADGAVVIVDENGIPLSPPGPASDDQTFQAALLAARAGRPTTGERGELTYATATIGAVGDSHGAVLVARSDEPVDRRVRQLWLALVVIGAGVLAVSVLVSHLLARWTIGALQQLDHAAAELGEGNLAVRAQVEAGPPEVIALARTFNDMADRLDELVEAQGRFVADASHQLRTPLTALRLRLDNLDSADAASVSSTRDAALLETARLSRLVDGLLALARAEGGTPRREPVDITAVVRERHETWAPLAAEQGIDLRLETNDDECRTAVLVPGHLEQILDNLIDNALDATPAGRAVELRADVDRRTVEIHVSDEGRGMQAAERRRAFDAFWQGPGASANGHTGLGLAIVDRLVRAGQGTISLDASPTGGIDAVLCFPATDAPVLSR